MKLKTFHTITFFCLLTLSAFAQPQNSHAEKFISFMNNYETDSLQKILTDDFILKRTFTRLSQNKSSFLNDYIPQVKSLNGKFKILESLSGLNPVVFVVEDESDYFKYLEIDNPTWKISIRMEGEMIREVIIDTTRNYQKYLAETKVKGTAFEKWLTQKYPGETQGLFHQREDVLIRRLKEYSNVKEE